MLFSRDTLLTGIVITLITIFTLYMIFHIGRPTNYSTPPRIQAGLEQVLPGEAVIHLANTGKVKVNVTITLDGQPITQTGVTATLNGYVNGQKVTGQSFSSDSIVLKPGDELSIDITGLQPGKHMVEFVAVGPNGQLYKTPVEFMVYSS